MTQDQPILIVKFFGPTSPVVILDLGDTKKAHVQIHIFMLTDY